VKLALLSDIHGNHFALQAALDAAADAGADALAVSGDLVGYYFEPLRVVELLLAWDCHLVRGNHEEMLAKAISDPDFLLEVDARYGTGLRCAIEQLDLEQLVMLAELPSTLRLQIGDGRILLCHGSPWNVDQYIYPSASDELLARCAAQEFDLVMLGHTHYPMLRQIGATLLVNPGSVGQPRNRVRGAHWALYDTETHSVDFRVEPYDMSALVDECRRRHPDLPYLSEVLLRV
jgi:putative phosphoesterase